MTTEHPDDQRWGWDLRLGRAVPWYETVPGEDVLGPYSTKEEAERWEETVERRNLEWETDDEEWEQSTDAENGA